MVTFIISFVNLNKKKKKDVYVRYKFILNEIRSMYRRL